MYEYDYATTHFILQLATTNLFISKIYSIDDSLLYLATTKGLKAFNIPTKKLFAVSNETISLALLNNPIKYVCADKHKNLLLAMDTGIVMYHPLQKKAFLLQTKPAIKNIKLIVSDNNENIWCSDKNLLYKIDKNNLLTVYKNFSGKHQSAAENVINDLLIDKDDKLWLATSRTGICLFDKQSNTFHSFYNDPMQPQSISTNLILSLFQGSDGTIWMGTEGYGLNYFNAQASVFHRLLPSLYQSPTLPDNWCRAAAEDKQHNWWLATATGVAMYNPEQDIYKIFQNKEGEKNQLYSNSVRSVFCASDGTVWIGTAEGLNRYHPLTNTMDFINEKNNMPESFYWNIAEDSNYNIWFACRDGIYTYNNSTKHFKANNDDSLLKPYSKFRTRVIFIDSKQRIWFGFDGKGLLLYDKAHHSIKYFLKDANDTTSLTYNVISSIAEDKNGVVWISTSSGLNAYNESAKNFHQYDNTNGLPSNKVSSLIVDKHNRLWMGTGAGLCMLDSNRKNFTVFKNDESSSAEFNDETGYKMSNGLFVYPTLKGFLYFNPDSFKQQNKNISIYLTAFRVNNKPFALNTNYESTKSIHLKWDENFFSFTLTATDYTHAQQMTYAFFLAPFDKDWVYTKEQVRNYTNVPGGNYVLHFKAINGTATSPEQTINIHVDTVFYKQTWFIAAISLMFLIAVFLMYRYRIRHIEKLTLLQSKAQSLEKEKTLVMYESLKQQLNPHFLFNSLSSLSGLIQKDQSAAKTFLDRLSKIYRYILKSSDSEIVSVSEDLKLAEIYVQLQQTRFGKGLQIKVDIDEQCMNKKIAPVTLQNLIENAIKHNIIDVESPLIINISAHHNYLVIKNNIQKKSFVEGSNKQGLKNMTTLYKYLCGKPLVQEETSKHFIVKIPFV